MRRKLTWLVLGAVIVGTALYHAGNVLGTPANGFVGTTLAKGRFGAIDVFILSAPHKKIKRGVGMAEITRKRVGELQRGVFKKLVDAIGR
jgi:hypothetical protein